MVRETPLHLGHLRTMTALAEMGAIIAPPVPAFYAGRGRSTTWSTTRVGRVLDLFGLEAGLVRRWRTGNRCAAIWNRMLAENRVRMVGREVSGQLETGGGDTGVPRESDAPLLFRRVVGLALSGDDQHFRQPPAADEDARRRQEFLPRWTELMATPVIPPVMWRSRTTGRDPPVGPAAGDLFRVGRRAVSHRGRVPGQRAGYRRAESVVPLAQIICDTELRIRLGSPHDLTRIRHLPSRETRHSKPRSCSGRRPNSCSPRRRRLLTTRANWMLPGGWPARRSRCAAMPHRRAGGAGQYRDRHRRPHPAECPCPGRPVRRFLGFSGRSATTMCSRSPRWSRRRDAIFHALVCGSAGGFAAARILGRDAGYQALNRRSRAASSMSPVCPTC